ncbi:MAG: metallophosphoesterase, partial [Alphaproteobacteria bacterium]|nr:metallophosphoesterase [Alphaproteobacteria bacterium]
MTRLIQITDTHLSPTHGFFYGNVARTLALINQSQPDMLVITGDLSINGPEVEDDLRFSRWCLRLAHAPTRFLPGNHDVGEEPGAEHLGQGITWERLAAYRRNFGTDFWVQDVDAWRLIGINTQLFGSGFDAEAAQWMLLENALAGASGRPCGLFMHKPLFLDAPDEEPEPTKAVAPRARRALIRLLEEHPVKFIASGHLHQY